MGNTASRGPSPRSLWRAAQRARSRSRHGSPPCRTAAGSHAPSLYLDGSNCLRLAGDFLPPRLGEGLGGAARRPPACLGPALRERPPREAVANTLGSARGHSRGGEGSLRPQSTKREENVKSVGGEKKVSIGLHCQFLVHVYPRPEVSEHQKRHVYRRLLEEKQTPAFAPTPKLGTADPEKEPPSGDLGIRPCGLRGEGGPGALVHSGLGQGQGQMSPPGTLPGPSQPPTQGKKENRSFWD